MKLIAIAGASCSGKSTLASALERALGDATTIAMDWYYRDLSHLTPGERARNNFDHPDALEHELLIAQLGALARGELVNAPLYDFSRHVRLGETTLIAPGEFVILEGLYALHWAEVRQLAHARIFVDLEHEMCLARRIARDVRERGRTEESVREQYAGTVQPMYDAHILPARAWADLVLRGDGAEEQMLGQALGRVLGAG